MNVKFAECIWLIPAWWSAHTSECLGRNLERDDVISVPIHTHTPPPPTISLLPLGKSGLRGGWVSAKMSTEGLLCELTPEGFQPSIVELMRA